MVRDFSRPKPRRDGNYTATAAVILFVLIIVGAVVYNVVYLSSRTTIENCTVDSKDRGVTVTSDDEGRTTSKTNYRVYTDCGVFVVEDYLLTGQWNSADTYGSLKEDHTYDLDVIGWRNGFFSWFPNILSASEVGK